MIYTIGQIRDFVNQISKVAGYDVLIDFECPKKVDFSKIVCICCDELYKCILIAGDGCAK